MKKYGIDSILLLSMFIFGAVAGRIVFNPSVELYIKLFVSIYATFFAIACSMANQLLEEWEFEQWKRRLGYV